MLGWAAGWCDGLGHGSESRPDEDWLNAVRVAVELIHADVLAADDLAEQTRLQAVEWNFEHVIAQDHPYSQTAGDRVYYLRAVEVELMDLVAL